MMKTSTSSLDRDPSGDESKALLEVKEKTACSPLLLDSSKAQFSSPTKENNTHNDKETEDIDTSMMRLSKTAYGEGGTEEYHLHSPNSVEVAIDIHPSFENFDEASRKTEEVDEEIGQKKRNQNQKKGKSKQGEQNI